MQDVIEGDRSSSEKESEGMKDGGGDWAYITFPNGVPTVREIKTNGGAQTNGAGAPNIVQRDPDVTNVANGIKKRLQINRLQMVATRLQICCKWQQKGCKYVANRLQVATQKKVANRLHMAAERLQLRCKWQHKGCK